MLRHLVLLFLLLLAIFYPYSQDQSHLPDYLSTYKSAEKLYNADNPTAKTDSMVLSLYLKVISMLEKGKMNDSILVDSYLKSGILEMSAREDQKALALFSGSIRVIKSSKAFSDSLLFKAYLFSGSCHYNLNDLDSARYYYKQAEELVNRYPTLNESERLYNKSGALFYETGDYKKSIQYFNKALSLVENRQPANLYFIVNYKNNIASAMRKLQEYDQAMDVYKSLLPYNINKNELFHNIGVTYLNIGNYTEAIHYLKQVLNSNQLKNNDIGLAYLQLKKYDSASHYLNAAHIEYKRIWENQKNLDYGITLKYQGDMMMAMNMPLQALPYYQQAIIQLDPDFNDTSIERNPLSFQGLHNSFFLFQALTAKAAALTTLYDSSPNTAQLTNAFSAYSSAMTLASKVEKTFNSDEAKLFLANNVGPAYKDVIDLCLRLYTLSKDKIYLHKAFNYAENSKASVLQASLRELSLESIAGLPQNLVRDEKNTKALIAKLNIQAAETNDSMIIAGIRRKITDLEISLSGLQEKLEENPKYNQLKFDTKDISLDSIQQKMEQDDAAMLSFYYLKNKLLCFYITKEQYGYSVTDLKDDLKKSILSLSQMLNEEGRYRNKIMHETTTSLFRQLIMPVFEKIKTKKRLIIVPHNEISYIPFEILSDPSTDELLLKKFAISYDYSANFFTTNEQSSYKQYQALAMAPFSESSSKQNFSVLKASRSEVETLKGKILYGGDATKQNFIQLSIAYPVIHLATHAVANDSDPLRSFIEFYGSGDDADTTHRLYEQEIYHLDMKSTRLVILSACETGNGRLVNGEGIMSLSRAFSYAGCKSVITSLWKADDMATAFISKQLHHYLQKGFRKDEALQHAKSDYLESNEIEPAHKTPAYWAHLVLIGDAHAIEKKGQLIPWIIFGLVFLILVTVIIKKAGHSKLRPAWYHRLKTIDAK